MAKFYKTYKITSVDAHDIALIAVRYGKDLIAIRHDGEVGEFVVTATTKAGGVIRDSVRVAGDTVKVTCRQVLLTAAA